MRTDRGSRAGFTLLELLLVLGMLVMLLAFAWPQMQAFVDDKRLTQGGEQLRNALREARREAIDDGIAYRCDVRAGTSRFRIVASSEPWDELASEPAARTTDLDEEDDFIPFRLEEQLPDDLRLLPRYRLVEMIGDEVSNEDASNDERSQDNASENDADPDLAADEFVDEEAWEPRFEFYPDGSAVSVTAFLVDRKRRFLVVRADALSGDVSLSEVRLGDEFDPASLESEPDPQRDFDPGSRNLRATR